ncbi:MAG TPA: RNA-binding protein [Xanthobacteraceae bacterium]|nr:RNA-binding protein [Xanthobacteraceae bacterium]
MPITLQDGECDRGPRRPAAERLCIATRTVRPSAEMIRFVLGPDGVVPDLKQRLPGRGVWVTATRAALSEAVARNAFARGFKREVRVGPELVELTERLLARAALDALAIARKAGLLVAGFAKTEAALARLSVVALLQARDAAADGTAKLAAALRHRPDADRIAIIDGFTTAQLDLALGRSNVVHAALLAGPESEAFLTRYARLTCFRTGAMSAAAESARAA